MGGELFGRCGMGDRQSGCQRVLGFDVDEDQQACSVRTVIRFWLTVPVKLSSHAHRRRARLFVPKSSLRWWWLFLDSHYPKRKPGRPSRARVILGAS